MIQHLLVIIIHHAPHYYPRVPNCTNRIAKPFCDSRGVPLLRAGLAGLGKNFVPQPDMTKFVCPFISMEGVDSNTPSWRIQHPLVKHCPSCTPLPPMSTNFQSSNCKALIQGLFNFCVLDWLSMQIPLSLNHVGLWSASL